MPRKKQNVPSEPTRRSRRQAGQAPEPVDEEQDSSKKGGQSSTKTASKKLSEDKEQILPPKTKTITRKIAPLKKKILKRSTGKRSRANEDSEDEEEYDPAPHYPAQKNTNSLGAWKKKTAVKIRGSSPRRNAKRLKLSRRHRDDASDVPEFVDSSSDSESEVSSSNEQSNEESQEEEDSEDESSDSDSDSESGSEEESQSNEDVQSTRSMWGWDSEKIRRNHPVVLRPAKKVHNWDHISLRFDPDGDEKKPIQGLMRYIVSRGYLLVVLPSLKTKSMGLERAVLVKGSEYPEAKQRFIDGGGMTVSSSDASCLANTDWQSFKVNNVATTLDGKMTLVEGYSEGSRTEEMKILSISTLRAAYGRAQADALVLLRRVSVGQTRLVKKEKKQNLPSDVVEFLTAHRLDKI